MRTTKSGKQRKMFFNAPLHKKRKWIAAHLEESLLLKYDRRSLPVVKGDTVRVMRGSFRGHEDKVARVNVKKGYLEIEGITMSKADGNKIAKPIHPSNVMITKLNLTDRWRRLKLEKGLSEEAKKEIEKEAEEQIKEAKFEAEEIRKKQEELEKEEEKKIKTEETTEKKETKKPTESGEKNKKETSNVKKQQTKEEKVEPEKKEAKKTSQKKRKTEKKTPSKKQSNNKVKKKGGEK